LSQSRSGFGLSRCVRSFMLAGWLLAIASSADAARSLVASSVCFPSGDSVDDPIRPSNQMPNCRMPTDEELAAFHSGEGGCGGLDDCSYMDNVDGQFTGTTEEILEFAADKWCPDCAIVNPLDGETYSFADLLKAIAVTESFWYQWQQTRLRRPDPI